MGEEGGGELIFRAALHRRMSGGRERPILQSEEVRPDHDEERARRRQAMGGDKKWWLAITMITLLFALTVVSGNPLIQVRTTNGAFHYKDMGGMYPGAGTATIRISLGGGEMCDALKSFNRAAKKAGGVSKWIAVATDHDILELERAMEFFDVSEEEEKMRNARGAGILGTVFNFFTGLFNKAKIADLEVRLDRQQDASKLELQEMDGIRDFAEKIMKAANATDEIMGNELDSMNKRQFKEHAQRVLAEEFALVNSNATSLTRILRSATSHRADPAIADLINMEVVWSQMRSKLKDKNMQLPGKDWQHIFAMPVDVYVRQKKVTIAIHFPTRPETARKMALHKWIPTPVFTNGQLLQVQSDLRVFGSDSNGDVAAISDIADCVQYGEEKFCKGPMVHERAGFFATCVCAVWRMDIEEIRALCEMSITPLRDSIVPVGTRTYQLVVETEMMLLIECVDGRTESKKVTAGMHQARVLPGCFLQNDLFRSEEGSGIDVQTTIVKALEEELGLLVPAGADEATVNKVTERLRAVKRPTPAASLRDEIIDDLEARGSEVTKFYVVIAVLAAGVLIAGAGAVFLLWKSGRLESVVRTNQQECRRHQQPPPQQEQIEVQPDRAEPQVENFEERARAADNVLAQLEATLRMAELRLDGMAPEEREEFMERCARAKDLVHLHLQVKPMAVGGNMVVPEAQQEFLAPDLIEGVMPEMANAQ